MSDDCIPSVKGSINYQYSAASGLSSAASFAVCAATENWELAVIIGVIAGCINFWNARGFQGKEINHYLSNATWTPWKIFLTILMSPLTLLALGFSFLVDSTSWLIESCLPMGPEIARWYYLVFFLPNAFISSAFTVFGFTTWCGDISGLTLNSEIFSPLGWGLISIYVLLNMPFALATSAVSNISEKEEHLKGQYEIKDDCVIAPCKNLFTQFVSYPLLRRGYRYFGSFWHAMEHVVSIVSCVPPEWMMLLLANPLSAPAITFGALVSGMALALILETYYFDGSEFRETAFKALDKPLPSETGFSFLSFWLKENLVPFAILSHAVADSFPILFIFVKVIMPALSLSAGFAYIATAPCFLALLVGLWYSELQKGLDTISKEQQSVVARLGNEQGASGSQMLPCPSIGPVDDSNTYLLPQALASGASNALALENEGSSIKWLRLT